MKKWIYVLLALLVLFAGYLAQSNELDAGKLTLKGVKFNTNLTAALEAAKVQGKPVFVYARSQYCGWCKKFEEETFTNQSVIQTLNENFISVSIDVDKQKNETRNFRVFGTPTEIFLDSNGTEIKRIPGYTDTETFLNIVKDPVFKYGD
ncbi:MAG: thioredoxin fold domain-containing protein [Candidatus Methanoperedens sp.]|nr:thioredoxin fold domain-containing protein [Candidatus Methanoperedens sp.]